MRISRPKPQFIDVEFGQDNDQGRGDTGGMATEITHRVNAARRHGKRCSDVLCNRRMPVKLKGNAYTTVVRPVLLYGAETWEIT